MAVRSVVVSDVCDCKYPINSEQAREFREKRVRFPPSALSEARGGKAISVSALFEERGATRDLSRSSAFK